MAPLKVLRLTASFWPVWGSAWELAPCHRGVTRGSAAWGSVQSARALAGRPETMGDRGRGAGIAGWRGSGTFLSPAPRETQSGGSGAAAGRGAPGGPRAAVCVHSNLRASTGGSRSFDVAISKGTSVVRKDTPPTSITLFMPRRSQTAAAPITVDFKRPQVGCPGDRQAAPRPPPPVQPKRYFSHEKLRP